MVEAVIELMLGSTGRFVLAVYEDYNVILNAIVIVYGLALLWAHVNLRREVRRMEAMMVDLAQKRGQGLEEAADPQAVHQDFVEHWRASHGRQKVLIPSRNDLWFARVDGADLVETLNIQPEYVRVALAKALALEPAEGGPNPERRAWELYRHQLLIGIRARHLEPEFQIKMRAERNRN